MFLFQKTFFHEIHIPHGLCSLSHKNKFLFVNKGPCSSDVFFKFIYVFSFKKIKDFESN